MSTPESRSERRRQARVRSNIEVEVLDLSKVLIDAKPIWFRTKAAHAGSGNPNQWPQEKKDRLAVVHNGDVGIVRTAKGIFGIDSEGVLHTIPLGAEGYDGYIVELYASLKSTDGESGFAEILPFAQFSINLGNVETLPRTGKKVLEDFVRVFGARLESNYEYARRYISELNGVEVKP